MVCPQRADGTVTTAPVIQATVNQSLAPIDRVAHEKQRRVVRKRGLPTRIVDFRPQAAHERLPSVRLHAPTLFPFASRHWPRVPPLFKTSTTSRRTRTTSLQGSDSNAAFSVLNLRVKAIVTPSRRSRTAVPRAPLRERSG